MMKRIAIITCGLLACCWGCSDSGGSSNATTGAPANTTASTNDAPLPAGTAGTAVDASGASAQGASGQTAQPNGAAPSAQPGSDRVLEKAAVGATGKGNYEPGLTTTPLNVYFTVKERVVYEIAIPQALALYEATNGFKPKTQEIFMKEIIEFNKIELPALPEGHRYVYDPKLGELMVEHPAE